MKITYQGTVRFLRNGETKVHVRFYSGRGPKTNAKALSDVEAWISDMLAEHGAYDCDATISTVIYHIKG